MHRWDVQRRPVDGCSTGPGEMAQNGRTRGGTFMAKWIVADKIKAGVLHAVVCPNVTGRTKKMIAQSKRARASSLALVPSGRLVCRCHGVFLWCFVCFVLLRFRLYAFVEAAPLRSIVLRYAFFFLFVYLEMSLFPSFFLYHFRFLFVWRVL